MKKLKRKIKVFESGIYPQGKFSKDKVTNIFSNIKDKIKGIFVHSSKWKEENREPLEVGTFDNFNINENGDNVEVYADIKFNDKGEKYYNDGILKGVSVEIDTLKNKLDKIAVLPIGTNPAVNGAEFQESDIAILEFKEVEMNREEVISSLTIDEIKSIKRDGYVIEVKEFEEIKPKTEEEIRAEILAEFEKKDKVKTEVLEFMSLNSKKITPAMGKILNEDTLTKIFSINETLEFEEGNISFKDVIKNIFNTLPELITNNKEIEFEREIKKEKSLQEIMEEARTKTLKQYNK